MNKRLIVFTYILFIINVIISILFFAISIFFVVKEPYIFPIIFFILFNLIFVLISVNYYRCIDYLKDNNKLKKEKIKKVMLINNMILIVDFINIIGFSLMILFFVLMYKTLILPLVYFLIIDIYSIFNFAITFFINRKLEKGC